MVMRYLLLCAAFECAAFADTPSNPAPKPIPAPRSPAALTAVVQREIDPLQALCLSGAGPIPDGKQVSEYILRIYNFAQTHGLVPTQPTFADAIDADSAPKWRICVSLKSPPPQAPKDMEPFAILQIAAAPGWRAQCMGFEDKVQDCIDELLKRIDAAGQVAIGTPRVVFSELQPEPENTITVVSVPTRNKPAAKLTPKTDGAVNPAPAKDEDKKPDPKARAGGAP